MKTVEQRIIPWFLSGDTGLSSKTICAHMMGIPYEGDAPSDTSDLGRCIRLLELVPEWKPRIKEMAQHGPAWAGLIGQWEHIVGLYKNESGMPPADRPRSPETYRAMKLAIADGYRNDSRYECSFGEDGTLSWSRLIAGEEDAEMDHD